MGSPARMGSPVTAAGGGGIARRVKNVYHLVLAAADDIVAGYTEVSSSKVLDTGDAHPVVVLGAAAIIKTGVVANHVVVPAARRLRRGGVLARRASGTALTVGARGLRHSTFAAGKAVSGALIVSRNALKGTLLVTRHAVSASARASVAVGRRSVRVAALAARAGIRKTRRAVVGSAVAVATFATQVALPAAVSAVTTTTAMVSGAAYRAALSVVRTGAWAAWNARQLSSAAAEVARDVVRRLITMLEKSRCVVLRVTHCSATAAVVVSRTAAGAISLSLAAGKSALVHTYRTPSYLRRGVRGACDGVERAVTCDYRALVAETATQSEIAAGEALPAFVFAAALVLRVGKEGPLPPVRDGYRILVSWADKTVEAILPPKSSMLAQTGPADSASGGAAVTVADGGRRVDACSSAAAGPSAGGVLVKTLSRSSVLVRACRVGRVCRVGGLWLVRVRACSRRAGDGS